MPKFQTGTAIVAVEQPTPTPAPGVRPSYTWHATHVEKFEPHDDTTQLVMELWLDAWDTNPTNIELMATTWEKYPEDPAVPLDEPLFTIATADTRDVVRKAFADYQNLDFVVTIDTAANVKVWRPSTHPVHRKDGGQQMITFSPVPTKVDEVQRWLSDMNNATRHVADRVKAVMRYQYNLADRAKRKSPPQVNEQEGTAHGRAID